MRKLLLSTLLIGCLSLVLIIPAFAYGTTPSTTYTGTTRTGDMGTYSGPAGTYTGPADTYNGTGTGYDGYNTLNRPATDGRYGTYGTGTYGAYDSTRMNMYNNNVTTRKGYRTTATTTTRGFSWGWLGLLGLFGLAGMRSRSREDIK